MEQRLFDRYKSLPNKGDIITIQYLPTQIKHMIKHPYVDIPLVQRQFQDTKKIKVSDKITFMKPDEDALWTTTLLKDGFTPLMKNEDFCPGKLALVIAQTKPAKILEIRNKLDLLEIWLKYGYQQKKRKIGVNWSEIAKDFDAVHFAYNDFYPLATDIESTIWFRSNMLELKAVVPIQIKNDEYLPIQVPKEWRSDVKEFPDDEWGPEFKGINCFFVQ